MKSTLLFLCLILTTCYVTIAQRTVYKTPFDTKYIISEKHGLTENEDDYQLIISHDDQKLEFQTYSEQMPTVLNVEIISDNYVVSKTTTGHYAIYLINESQLYMIDYFMRRYSVSGYGKGSQEVKENTQYIMRKLKQGSIPRDIILEFMELYD